MSTRSNPKVRSTKAQRWFDRDGLLIGSAGRRYVLDDRGRVLATFRVQPNGHLKLDRGSIRDLAHIWPDEARKQRFAAAFD